MSMRKIARNYARAMADTLPDDAAVRRLEGELREFASVFADDDEVRHFLAGPLISNDKKIEAVEKALAGGGGSAELRKFVRLLIERNRINLLPEMAEEFSATARERLGIVDAEVVSALPLTDELKERARASLKRITGRDVRAEFQVDPNVLGGIRAQVGSTIYDGSVRGRLERMRTRFSSD
jgi:F-type H+-transporting ATPase subunit delta